MRVLRVRVLGGLAVDGLEPSALGSRKQRRLLARLAVASGGPVTFDALSEDLWGQGQPASPRDQLAVLVSRLRGVLGTVIHRTDAGYQLEAEWCDLSAFAERQDVAARRAARSQWAAAAEAGRSALALLRGPLLPEFADADWVSLEQVGLDRATQDVRRTLAQAELEVGDARRAIDLSLAAVTASPYDEVALRLHLAACLKAGSPALGLTTYAESRQRLADELGVDPAPETQNAYEQLLAATERPPVPVIQDAPPGRTRDVQEALARIGEGGLLVLTGEPGIGKTRVLEAIGSAAPCMVLRARCDELGQVLPLEPILRAVSEALSGRTPQDVARLLGDDAGLLAPVLGFEVARSGTSLPDGGMGQLLLHAALHRLIERLADGEPVLLLVDDGHYADPASVALLAALGSGPGRITAVVAARSGQGPSWSRSAVRELGPLDLSAVTEWVGPGPAAALHARSGGHPLLLQEILAYGEQGVPPSLAEAYADAADAAGRAGATLRAASIVGPDLDLDVLAAVLHAHASDVLDDLEEGVRRRLLIERTSGFAFRHQLIREALAASAGPTRRALLHRETARVLDGRGDADPLVVAHHAQAGGLTEVAAQALVRAGEVAAGRFAHAQSLALAEQALDLDPANSTALLVRARALLVLARYAEAAECSELAVEAGAGAAALQVGALAAHYVRQWERAAELGDRAAALAGDEDARRSSLAIAAHALHAAGDVLAAEARWEQAGGSEDLITRAPPGWVALLRHHQGRSREVLALTERTQHAQGLDQLALPLVQMSRGLALAALGNSAQALECFQATQELVERLDLRRYAGRADNCRGYVLRNLGHHEYADDLNTAALEAGQRIGLDEPIAHALLDLTEGRLRVDDLSGAQELLERAEEFGREDRRHGFQWRHRVRSQWLRGRLLLATGDLDAAADCALQVVTEAGARSMPRYQAFGDLLALHVRVRRGEPPPAIEAAAVAAALADVASLEQPWLVGQVHAGATGDVREALASALGEATERLRRGAPDDFAPSAEV